VVRPSAVAACFCPRGSELTPACNCTATRADMNRPMPIAAVQNGALGSCFSHNPAALGSNSGNTKNHRNNCTNSGMLRKNST
jgi:hypothetical protein